MPNLKPNLNPPPRTEPNARHGLNRSAEVTPPDLDTVCAEAAEAVRGGLLRGRRGMRIDVGVPSLDPSRCTSYLLCVPGTTYYLLLTTYY